MIKGQRKEKVLLVLESHQRRCSALTVKIDGHGFIGREDGAHHPVPRLAFYVTTSCSQS